MCDVFETLPQWQQEDIEKSYEYLAANENNTPAPAKTEEAESLSSLADKAAADMNSPDLDEDNKKESDIPY